MTAARPPGALGKTSAANASPTDGGFARAAAEPRAVAAALDAAALDAAALDAAALDARPGGSIWRLAEIRWIFAARVASVAGDWVYQIALVWLVLQVTGSSVALSAVALAQVVPLIAMSALLSGRLVRVVRPAALAAFDIAQAVAAMALPVLYWVGWLNLAWFVAVAIVITILDSVCDPGLQAVVPQLVDRQRIPAVHSLFDLTRRLGRILGPGFTSLLLIVLPIAGLFAVDAASFLFSAWCMLFAGRLVARRRHTAEESVRERATEATPADPAGPATAASGSRASLRSTYRYLRENPILWWLFTVRNGQNMLWSIYLIGVPVLVQRAYHRGPGVWGLLIAVYAAGQLAGNWLTTRRRGYRRVVPYVVGGWAVAGLGFVGLGALADPILGGLCLFLGGAGGAAANVSTDSYVGVTVPAHLQPAAFSWQFTGNQLSQMLGTAGLGLVLAAAPVRGVVIVTGLAMVAATALALMVARSRRLRPADLTGKDI